VNPRLLLCLVLLATFGLSSLLLSGLVALAWRAGVKQIAATSADFLTLRLLPVAGAVLLAFTVVLPAFLRHEPQRQSEAAGPLLVMLAAFSLVCATHAIWRGWRACIAARALLNHGRAERRVVESGQEVRLVDVAEPLTAVIGVWHPRIITAESVRSTCSQDEFRQVIAHETAHIRARDNLKLLLLVAAPDALAWTALGATLRDHWRIAAEREADRRATGDDPEKRLALASALIKVSRLVNCGDRTRLAPSMAVAVDDVAGRVRLLLKPAALDRPARILHALAFCALLTPVVALPLHAFVHEIVEQLVRFRL
jgi:beta-lactamase regulating signal transducer with metallopeptidase domain